MYICPVCGYNELPHAPEDWTICPCCNTMFGYSDENWGVDALRQEWIQAGAQWGSEDMTSPPNWSPVEQLRKIGYEISDADRIAIARVSDNNIVVPINTIWGQLIRAGSVSITGDQHNVVIQIFPDNKVERQSPPTDVRKLVWQSA